MAERGGSSERTRAALAARKASGKQLGNPRNIRQAGEIGRLVQVAEADDFAANMRPTIAAIQAAGVIGLAAVADVLNARGTPRSAQQVRQPARDQKPWEWDVGG